MMGTSHMLIGAAAGLGAAYLLQAPAPLELMAVATFTALLPDIDHPQGTLRRKIPLVDDLLLFWLPHRGITHTVAALALVSLVAFLLYHQALISLPIAVAIGAGYASHLLADMMTISGLKVAWPLSDKTLHLWPGLRGPVCGPVASPSRWCAWWCLWALGGCSSRCRWWIWSSSRRGLKPSITNSTPSNWGVCSSPY